MPQAVQLTHHPSGLAPHTAELQDARGRQHFNPHQERARAAAPAVRRAAAGAGRAGRGPVRGAQHAGRRPCGAGLEWQQPGGGERRPRTTLNHQRVAPEARPCAGLPANQVPASPLACPAHTHAASPTPSRPPPPQGLPFRGFAERLGQAVMPAFEAAREQERAAARAARRAVREPAEVVVPQVPHLLPFTRWAASSTSFRDTFIADPPAERKKARLSWYHPDDTMVPRDWWRNGLLADLKVCAWGGGLQWGGRAAALSWGAAIRACAAALDFTCPTCQPDTAPSCHPRLPLPTTTAAVLLALRPGRQLQRAAARRQVSERRCGLHSRARPSSGRPPLWPAPLPRCHASHTDTPKKSQEPQHRRRRQIDSKGRHLCLPSEPAPSCIFAACFHSLPPTLSPGLPSHPEHNH